MLGIRSLFTPQATKRPSASTQSVELTGKVASPRSKDRYVDVENDRAGKVAKVLGDALCLMTHNDMSLVSKSLDDPERFHLCTEADLTFDAFKGHLRTLPNSDSDRAWKDTHLLRYFADCCINETSASSTDGSLYFRVDQTRIEEKLREVARTNPNIHGRIAQLVDNTVPVMASNPLFEPPAIPAIASVNNGSTSRLQRSQSLTLDQPTERSAIWRSLFPWCPAALALATPAKRNGTTTNGTPNGSPFGGFFSASFTPQRGNGTPTPPDTFYGIIGPDLSTDREPVDVESAFSDVTAKNVMSKIRRIIMERLDKMTESNVYDAKKSKYTATFGDVSAAIAAETDIGTTLAKIKTHLGERELSEINPSITMSRNGTVLTIQLPVPRNNRYEADNSGASRTQRQFKTPKRLLHRLSEGSTSQGTWRPSLDRHGRGVGSASQSVARQLFPPVTKPTESETAKSRPTKTADGRTKILGGAILDIDSARIQPDGTISYDPNYPGVGLRTKMGWDADDSFRPTWMSRVAWRSRVTNPSLGTGQSVVDKATFQDLRLLTYSDIASLESDVQKVAMKMRYFDRYLRFSDHEWGQLQTASLPSGDEDVNRNLVDRALATINGGWMRSRVGRLTGNDSTIVGDFAQFITDMKKRGVTGAQLAAAMPNVAPGAPWRDTVAMVIDGISLANPTQSRPLGTAQNNLVSESRRSETEL